MIHNPSLLLNRLKIELAKKDITVPGCRVPLPAVIYMAPTMRCNLHCRICGLQANLSRPERIPPNTDFSREMSWKNWCDFLDQIGTFKPKVLLSGGEPLLSEHTIPIVERLSQRYRMHVGVGTNGLLLEDCAADLFKAGIRHLYISIDGVNDVYESIRGNGNFAQLDRSLATLHQLIREYGSKAPGVNAIIVMTPETIPHLLSTVQYLSEFGIRRFSVQHFFHFSSLDLASVSACTQDPRQNPRWTWGEQIDTDQFDIGDISAAINQLRIVARTKRDLHIEFVPDLSIRDLQNYYRPRPMPDVPGFKCPLFRLGTYIYPDGSVIPAHFCHFYSVGNVRMTSFRDIWYGSEYTWIRRTIAKEGWLPVCSYCMIPYGACI